MTPTDPLETIKNAGEGPLVIFEVTMVPEVPGGQQIIYYVEALTASMAAEHAEVHAEADKKAKLRVGTLRRLGYVVK